MIIRFSLFLLLSVVYIMVFLLSVVMIVLVVDFVILGLGLCIWCFIVFRV